MTFIPMCTGIADLFKFDGTPKLVGFPITFVDTYLPFVYSK